MSLTTQVKVAKFSFLNKKSYNKTVIDLKFGRHKDLSTLKSDIHLGIYEKIHYLNLILGSRSQEMLFSSLYIM